MPLSFIELKSRFLKLDTTHFCDASDKVHLLSNHIRPITMGLKMFGIAHTVESQGDLLSVMKALQDAQANEVLIINSVKSLKAVAGELFATEAKRKSLAGFIIDGACRDVEALRNLGLPVFAKSICAQAGTKSNLGKTQIPLICGEVRVSPNDIIFADDNGIISINPNEVEIVLSLAEKIKEREEAAIRAMQNGQSLFDFWGQA